MQPTTLPLFPINRNNYVNTHRTTSISALRPIQPSFANNFSFNHRNYGSPKAVLTAAAIARKKESCAPLLHHQWFHFSVAATGNGLSTALVNFFRLVRLALAPSHAKSRVERQCKPTVDGTTRLFTNACVTSHN